jgi:2-amino-4-hydroxy-6-hydroxymethyldihydropteridine diphosphokinase
MSRAVLSLGANLGDAAGALQSAVDAMRSWLIAVSPAYRTAAWGPVEQPDYLNAVIIVDDPAASPLEWLTRAQAAEQAAGRTRDVRWGPRTLDVDVIDVDGLASSDPMLSLPHPRAAERAFVLVPWLAVDPEARLAGRSVAALVTGLPGSERAGVELAAQVELR